MKKFVVAGLVFVLAVVVSAWSFVRFIDSQDGQEILLSEWYVVQLCEDKAYAYSDYPSRFVVFEGDLLVDEVPFEEVREDVGDAARQVYFDPEPEVVNEYSVLLEVEELRRNTYLCRFISYERIFGQGLMFYAITSRTPLRGLTAAEELLTLEGISLGIDFFATHSTSDITFQDKWQYFLDSR